MDLGLVALGDLNLVVHDQEEQLGDLAILDGQVVQLLGDQHHVLHVDHKVLHEPSGGLVGGPGKLQVEVVELP